MQCIILQGPVGEPGIQGLQGPVGIKVKILSVKVVPADHYFIP